MIQTGEVVAKEGGVLTVVFERPAACGNCRGCLSRRCTNVELPGDALVGDRVDVSLPEKNIVGASAIAYLIPLGLFLAGLLGASPLHQRLSIAMGADLFAAILGGVCLGIGLCAVWRIDKGLRQKQNWQPRIVAVHTQDQRTSNDQHGS